MSDIETRLFRYFVALAEEQHFAFVAADTARWAEAVKYSHATVD